MLITKKTQKTQNYFCKNCQFITRNKTDFERHVVTPKHQKNNPISFFCSESSLRIHRCICGKQYKYPSGLSAHKKKCGPPAMTQPTTTESSESELIKYLLKENQEFKQLIIEHSSKMLEQNNKMIEIASKPSTINNNCHQSHHFNLNVFLNEKCKNAMNMKDFINSLQIMDADFEDIGKLGYVQGISNIFLKGLKELDETTRPLHCSDIKRDTLYIKDDDTWNRDDNNEKIIEAIHGLSHKNVKYIPIWRDANPDALDAKSKKSDQYMRIVNQVMTSIVPDDPHALGKIIRNVATCVTIDKDSNRYL
jgi:hypothetical protein